MTESTLSTEGLAALVRSRRTALGLSLREMARRGGLGTATVHKIEQGRLQRVPTPATLTRLARALDLPESQLTEAAMSDLGVRRYDLSDQRREAMYIAARNLTDAQLDVVMQVIASMDQRHLRQ